MIDCNVFCDSVFSLIKHCVATLSTSFCRARPIFWCSIPFFSLKCMCVEKNWYECTLVVILSKNVINSYYLSHEVTNHATILDVQFSRSSIKLHRSWWWIIQTMVLSCGVAFPFCGKSTKTRVTGNTLNGYEIFDLAVYNNHLRPAIIWYRNYSQPILQR